MVFSSSEGPRATIKGVTFWFTYFCHFIPHPTTGTWDGVERVGSQGIEKYYWGVDNWDLKKNFKERQLIDLFRISPPLI